MSTAPRIIYSPRPDAAPENEISAIADVYSFVLRCAREKKKGGPETAPDDAMKGSKHEVRAAKNHSR